MSNIAVAQEATVFIYGLCDPRDGKIKYVGKAKDLQVRLKSHFKCAKRTSTPKNAWLLKLKSLGMKPEMIILEQVRKSFWSEAERWWISKYREWEPNLKNVDDGGRGRSNYAVSMETRERLSIAGLGRRHTDESKRRMSIAQKNKIISDEGMARLVASGRANLGRRHTDAARHKMSLARRGVPKSAEHRRKMSLAHMGKTIPAESRAKMSAAKQGWKPSERMTEIQREKCKGEGNGRALLTEAQVLEIRKRYAAGSITYLRLAEDYPVTFSTIHRIVKRRLWKHV